MSNASAVDYNLDVIDINGYRSKSDAIYELEREMRLQKSRQIAAANRREAFRRRRIAFTVLGIAVALVIVLMTGLFVKAGNDSAEDLSFKYYTQIVVKSGQTLNSIATEYSDNEHYESIQDYVDEVVFINSISDPDCIQAGCVLVIPYYSNEYK